jgi:hypothetical protein
VGSEGGAVGDGAEEGVDCFGGGFEVVGEGTGGG